MTMLEKVARALAMSAGAAIVGSGQSRATREFRWEGDGGHFEKYVEAHWKEHMHAAGFAVSAMREPTNLMAQAGDERMPDAPDSGDSVHVWKVMIDAALAETPV